MEKRPRTEFSEEQKKALDLAFYFDRRLTPEWRRYLSQRLGLNEEQIERWFRRKEQQIGWSHPQFEK
uniref:Computational designed homodimer n=1 Tax=Drosophila melanogaster TaxID=7227 RepID=UPI0006149AB1|nr:Chain A, Computational designed homodimer [Drosophila melanogaster]2MG4_B Chain B, Computational designed homodimer [Drosophila melanogaster]